MYVYMCVCVCICVGVLKRDPEILAKQTYREREKESFFFLELERIFVCAHKI